MIKGVESLLNVLFRKKDKKIFGYSDWFSNLIFNFAVGWICKNN